jgi:uncharacterized protein
LPPRLLRLPRRSIDEDGSATVLGGIEGRDEAHRAESGRTVEVPIVISRNWYNLLKLQSLLSHLFIEGNNMINKKIIEEVKNRLIKTYDPVAIYLFGSYAWGHPDDESDLDLLIVVEQSDEKSYKRPIPGHRALRGLDISKDIIVQTRDVFDRRSKEITTLEFKIKRDGKVLYARA